MCSGGVSDARAVSLLGEGVGWLSRAPGCAALVAQNRGLGFLSLSSFTCWLWAKPPAFSAEVSLLRCSLRLWEGKWAMILALQSKPGPQSLRGWVLRAEIRRPAAWG